ncbi:Acetamidase [Apiospora kogelbergensis]|uniref:Acetamidase n=1 Tax=Apiospora kogelbergensis TaxID=1337665 RepID=UPI00312EE862
MKVDSWEQVAARKRKAVLDSIPAEWIIPDSLLPPETQDDVMTFPETSGWFTAEELAITNSEVLELLPKLASGELKSETVTRAFCKRAAAAHQLTNCLSETCFERGLEMARQLDAHLAQTGKPVGPLHGLPISLKDNFNLQGLDATVGFVSHVGAPATEDATLAQLLQAKAGAVFYVKTNVPTAMMMPETVNNVMGRTVNPRNRRLTPGGSSGGEAALPLGVGTDIGGSLRIPAACTGLFTLKASFGRFPALGCRSGMPGQEAVQSINGPLARTLGDLEAYCAAVVGAEPWHDADPRCLPIPWRSSPSSSRKLKIAVMWDDGMALPTPPVTRALRQTAAALRAAGHELVEWSSRDQAEGLSLLNRMFVADGGRAILEEIARTGEPWILPAMQAYQEAAAAGVAAELGTRDLWRLHAERQAYQKRHLDRWNAAGIDVLLCPTTPYASVENGKFRHVGYTGVYNVLDQSCISFPTGIKVDAALDKALDMASYQPMSEVDKMIQSEYHAEAVHGMPINLQLVGRRLEEEKVVAMTRVVLDALS